MDPTRVTFPTGATTSRGRVVLTQPTADPAATAATAVVTDVTCFHPVDPSWPDQPGDRGQLGGAEVTDCLTGAIGPDGQLRIGDEIPARRGDPDWTWVVAHLVASGAAPAVGDEVDLRVDEQYRTELSAAHTACHLAALALNRAAAGLWRKAPGRTDSLGSPDLDSLAIQRSTITPLRSVDEYRLGKSIRKKGLNSAELLEQLPELGRVATEQIAEWTASGAVVAIDTSGDDTLTARRTWRCELPDGIAEYPCGGTHLTSLSELPGPVSVTYQPTETGFTAVVTIGDAEA